MSEWWWELLLKAQRCRWSGETTQKKKKAPLWPLFAPHFRAARPFTVSGWRTPHTVHKLSHTARTKHPEVCVSLQVDAEGHGANMAGHVRQELQQTKARVVLHLNLMARSRRHDTIHHQHGHVRREKLLQTPFEKRRQLPSKVADDQRSARRKPALVNTLAERMKRSKTFAGGKRLNPRHRRWPRPVHVC